MAGIVTKENNKNLLPRIVLIGEPGSGKTTLAATSANLGNTLLISYNSQPQVILSNTYKYQLTPWRVNSIPEVNDIANWLASPKSQPKIQKQFEEAGVDTNFQWVILDGWSNIQAEYAMVLARNDLKELDKPIWKHGTNSLTNLTRFTYDEFGELLLFSNSLTQHFSSLPFNLIVTTLEGNGGILSMGSGDELLLSMSNVLARCQWNGSKSLLRISAGGGWNCSYRYFGKHDKQVLTDTTIGKLLFMEEGKND